MNTGQLICEPSQLACNLATAQESSAIVGITFRGVALAGALTLHLVTGPAISTVSPGTAGPARVETSALISSPVGEFSADTTDALSAGEMAAIFRSTFSPVTEEDVDTDFSFA